MQNLGILPRVILGNRRNGGASGGTPAGAGFGRGAGLTSVFERTPLLLAGLAGVATSLAPESSALRDRA